MTHWEGAGHTLMTRCDICSKTILSTCIIISCTAVYFPIKVVRHSWATSLGGKKWEDHVVFGPLK